MKMPHATLSQTVRVRLLAFVTIAVTAVISFSSLRNLAGRAGFHDLAWLFPVCLDAVAALGMDLWLSNSPARRGARNLALGAIVLSTVGNIFDWGIRSALWMVPVWLAPALGAIPPIGLASLLLVLHRHGGANTGPLPSPGVNEPSTGPRSATRTRRTPVPRRTRVTGTGTGTRPPDAELIETIRKLEADGTPITRRGAMEQFRIGSQKATELIAAARNGQGQEL